jgi:hypothetical protein
LNGRSTNRAWISGALVDPEIVLKVTAAINPIDAGTLALNPLHQYLPDAGP